jgi:hypothetical protein
VSNCATEDNVPFLSHFGGLRIVLDLVDEALPEVSLGQRGGPGGIG